MPREAGTEPGISRNAYGLLGSGSVLLELRGGIGQKSGGYIQKIGYQVASPYSANSRSTRPSATSPPQPRTASS